MKSYEKKALIKFMLIYMVSTFILELGVATLYFFEQRTHIVRELQDEMIAYTSLSRDGNAIEHFEEYSIDIEPARRHQYPKFYEDKKSFVSVSCASKFYPEKVFIVTAEKSLIEHKINELLKKVAFLMFIGFVLFFGVSYYLARLSIRPITQAGKMIDTVVEDIVHDLNAPMTSIAMNCESLETNLQDEKNIKKVHRIQSSNKTIRFLYNNLQLLLDKPMPLNSENVDVADILNKRIEFLAQLHPEAAFEISLEPFEFFTDKYALERVIDNILTNSIKYSQPHPLIKIRSQERSVIIEDNGIGIKDCSKIFERHYREIQGANCSGGLGLGLSIVKKLCTQMDITIELHSEYKKGSSFKLTFPANKVGINN
ncbi:MAG: HAMP domain-containing sensor histidine kinase [Sulfurimonas sp.]|nr:HAMP domain-containing sensor histidine kinase [Sulfurimonas sp.]